MNDNKFDRENYDDGETVKQEPNLITMDIPTNRITWNREYKMTREILTSDHKFNSLGLFLQQPIEFTTLPDSISKFVGNFEFEGLMSLHFYYSLDFVEH